MFIKQYNPDIMYLDISYHRKKWTVMMILKALHNRPTLFKSASFITAIARVNRKGLHQFFQWGCASAQARARGFIRERFIARLVIHISLVESDIRNPTHSWVTLFQNRNFIIGFQWADGCMFNCRFAWFWENGRVSRTLCGATFPSAKHPWISVLSYRGDEFPNLCKIQGSREHLAPLATPLWQTPLYVAEYPQR